MFEPNSDLTANQETVIGYAFGDDVSSLIAHMTHWGNFSSNEGVEYRNAARDVDNYSGTPFWGTRGQQWDAGFIFIRPDLY